MKAATWFVLTACLTTGLLWQTAQAGALSACDKGQISRQGACEDPEEVVTTPAEVESKHGIPSSSCRFGYGQQGSRLCMTGARGPNSFANAVFDCMVLFGRVADYHDWRYRRFRGDGALAPVGWWIGPLTADNRALFVNLPNDADFEGETNRFESRFYACAHDDSL